MIKILIVFIALLAGIASSTQGLYNGYWKEQIDLKTILLFNALVVVVLVSVFYLLSSGDGLKLSLDKVTPSIIIGGACGFFIILAFAIAFPSLGATTTSLLFIIAFLTSSMIYDHFGALNLTPDPITFQKLIGLFLVIVGTFLALKK